MLAVGPAFLEKDETKKAELMKKFQTEDAPRYLGYIDQLIGKFGKDGYAVTNTLTMADCAIHAAVAILSLTAALDKFPKIAACMKKLGANKNVTKWLKERPETAN